MVYRTPTLTQWCGAGLEAVLTSTVTSNPAAKFRHRLRHYFCPGQVAGASRPEKRKTISNRCGNRAGWKITQGLVHSCRIECGALMSLVVKLEDDLGERSDWIIMHGVLPARAEREFSCLRSIDPYGKMVFNHLQME